MGGIVCRFGQEIRSRRSSLGLSQEALAELAGISRGYLGQVERGRAVPSLMTMQSLADALGETLSTLIISCEDDLD